MEACLNSLFKFDAESYAEVYGGADNIHLGLEALKAALNKQKNSHATERTRYAVTLLFLEGRLNKSPQNQTHIRKGIEAAAKQLRHFEMSHINVISTLAETYREAVSPLGPKIIVKGEQAYLSNPDHASRIRALLLAGIRAVVLWRQAGGKRWRLLLERNAVLREIDVLHAAR